MAIKIDAGILQALALDDELLVVTSRPAAIQCIRWVPDRAGNQTTTGLLSRMQWLTSKSLPAEVVYDRPMNLFVWTMGDGKAYAVRRIQGNVQGRDSRDFNPLFDGHQFHTPETDEQRSTKAAVNSKFSLIAIGCANASIWLYSVRDYSGGITCFRRLTLPVSVSTSGGITSLAYSPDGYCLFAGFEHGWMVWSVYGQPGASSFGHEITTALDLDKRWLAGVLDAFWTTGGSEVVILNKHASCFYVLEFVRSALTNCLASSNVSNALLQTSGGLKIYQGYDTPDLTTISADVSLWHEVNVPFSYLDEQWPMKAAVASPDGRYLAVAGQRGLAHYSVASGRWKVFEDVEMQNEFSVRGGMCWHQHILIAAVETDFSHEVRSSSCY